MGVEGEWEVRGGSDLKVVPSPPKRAFADRMDLEKKVRSSIPDAGGADLIFS